MVLDAGFSMPHKCGGNMKSLMQFSTFNDLNSKLQLWQKPIFSSLFFFVRGDGHGYILCKFVWPGKTSEGTYTTTLCGIEHRKPYRATEKIRLIMH